MNAPASERNPAGLAPTADRERPFRTDHLLGDLERRSVRGGVVTLAAQAVKFALQLTGTILLARLLEPADFGLVAMVAVPANFLALFSGLGLPQAMVQRADLTHDQVSTLFWINVSVSALLMFLVAALSPLAAWFYTDPRLAGIGLGMASSLFLGGLGLQHQALLTRQMRLGRLAAMDLVSLATGFGVGLAMALQGFGYWSLVAIPGIMALVTTTMAWTASGWYPGRPQRGVGVRALLRFGGPVQGVDLAIYLISTLDNVAVGRFMGATELGLYGRAFQLLTMPVSLVTLAAARFVVPALSRLYPEPARYRRYFRVAVELVAAIAWPMVACLLLIGDDLVLLLLGPDWLRAASLFRLLAPAALVVPVLHTLGWVCLSSGTVRRQFLWSATFVPLFAAAFLVGALSGGTEGVALGCSVMNLVFFGVGVGYCLHGSPVRPGDVAAALWRPLGVVLLTTVGSAIMVAHLPWHLGPGGRLTLSVGVFCALYLAAYLVVPGGRALIVGVMATLGWRVGSGPQEI